MANIAKKIDGEVVIRDPFSEMMIPASDVSAVITSANNRLAERAAQFDALGSIDEATIEAVKVLRKGIEADDKTLRDYESDLKEALLDLSGFKPFVVQTKGTGHRIDPLSVRGKFASMLKPLKDREDSEKIVVPPTSWVIDIYANEEQLTKLASAAKKIGVDVFRWAKPQNDKAKKTIIKFFEENM